MQSNSVSKRQKIPNDGYFVVCYLPIYKDMRVWQKRVLLQKTRKKCSKASKTILFFLLLGVSITTFAQVNRTDNFRKCYTLKQVVVLSRHNIRSPLSGRASALQRITPHEWYHWSSAPSELSLRGGALETMMGQYFRKWLVSEGLMKENEIPAEGTMRFYANSL